MPLRSARSPRQKSSRPVPIHVIGPIPVMTARRLAIPVWGGSVPRFIFQICLHALQSSSRDWMNKAASDDGFGDWGQGGNTEPKIMHDLGNNAGGGFLERPD